MFKIECSYFVKLENESIFYRGGAKARRFAEGFGIEIVDSRLGNTMMFLQTFERQGK